MSYWRRRGNAFVYAFNGMRRSLGREPHMRIHLAAAVVTVGAGLFFSISSGEWLAVLGCMVLVMASELFNTAIEKVCDLISREQDERIGYIKDICSAAVLLACLFALAVAAVVFVPKLTDII